MEYLTLASMEIFNLSLLFLYMLQTTVAPVLKNPHPSFLNDYQPIALTSMVL